MARPPQPSADENLVPVLTGIVHSTPASFQAVVLRKEQFNKRIIEEAITVYSRKGGVKMDLSWRFFYSSFSLQEER